MSVHICSSRKWQLGLVSLTRLLQIRMPQLCRSICVWFLTFQCHLRLFRKELFGVDWIQMLRPLLQEVFNCLVLPL